MIFALAFTVKAKVPKAVKDNVSAIVKDLFHSPPIFKAKVTPSWIRGRKVETKGNLNSV